jgi:RNA polymerase sigma factor (sigma-70 family)
MADDAAQPDESLAALQQAEQVRRALEQLDARCQALLKLLFSDDDLQLGYDEIAQRLGTPTGSIGPTRARCLGKLRGLVTQPAF